MKRIRGLLCMVLVAMILPGAPAVARAVAVPVVSGLTTNGLTDPLAVAAGPPRLSWRLDADRRGVRQTRYQVRVGPAPDRLDLWDSGIVESPASVDVTYAGPALTPYTAYFWSVRVWDETGTASAWSPVATFETAALQPADWRGDEPTSRGSRWPTSTYRRT